MTSAPRPRDAPGKAPSREAGPGKVRPRREYVAALAGCALGAALVLGAAGRPWAHLIASSGRALPLAEVEVTGSAASSAGAALSALGVAGLAATAGLVATRGRLRLVVGAAVLALGALAGAASADALSRVAGGSSYPGLPSGAEVEASLTAWPAVSIAGSVLLVAVGLLAVARGRRWPAMSGRYDAPAGQRGGHPRTDQRAAGGLWEALDRGEDPTV